MGSSEWDSQWSRRQHVQHSGAPGVPHSTSLSQLRRPHPGVPPVQHRDDGLPRVALLQTGLVTQPPHPLVQRRGPAGHEELSAQTSHPPRRLTLLPLLGGQRQRAVPVEVRDDQDQIVEVSQEADLSVLDEDEYYNDVEDSQVSLKPESKPENVSTSAEVESSLEL